MRRLITAFLFIAPFAASGQGLVPFASKTNQPNPPVDTAVSNLNGRFSGVLSLPLYATGDTNKVFGIDANGRLVLRTKTTSGGGGGTGTVTSVGFLAPSAFTVSGSPVTSSGNITLSGAGTSAQYITGAGALALFPTNVSQFTNDAGYRTNITGLITAGTNVSITGNGTTGSPYQISASGGGGGSDPRVDLLDSMRKYGSNPAWMPFQRGLRITYTVADPITKSVTVNVPDGYFYTGTNLFGGGYLPSTPPNGLTIPNTQALILNATSQPAKWYAAAPTNVNDTPGRFMFLVNTDADLGSGIADVDKYIVDPTVTVDTVKRTVTVCPSGCNYTSITSAISALEGTATATNRWTVFVLSKATPYYENGPDGLGLLMRDYIDIVGQSRDSVVIIGPRATSGPQEAGYSTIATAANCTIRNLTVIADSSKYAAHFDMGVNSQFRMVAENCRFWKRSSLAGQFDAVGIGIRGGQYMDFRNCIFDGGFYAHDNETVTTRDTNKYFTITITGCVGKSYQFVNWIEYSPNFITISNSRFNHGQFDAVFSEYNANPTDRRANRGYMPDYTRHIVDGNTFLSLAYNAEGAALLKGNPVVNETLIQRLTTAQRDALPSPIFGIPIFNTTTNTLNYYNGTVWKEVAVTP